MVPGRPKHVAEFQEEGCVTRDYIRYIASLIVLLFDSNFQSGCHRNFTLAALSFIHSLSHRSTGCSCVSY
jgi:hypothetical protein